MAPKEATSGESLNGSRIILADDDFLVREGLASLLERAEYKVVAQTETADDLLELVREHEPNLVVVDIRMPPTHTTEGLEAARAIRQEAPDIGILVFSAHVEVEHAIELLATVHRIGYLLKSRLSRSQELIEALERILEGGSVVDPTLVQELVSARRKDDPLTDLTTREREVLGLMAEGKSNAAIARTLWVTEGTVEKHVHNIFGKLRLAETGDDHRRVLAVVAFLESSWRSPA